LSKNSSASIVTIDDDGVAYPALLNTRTHAIKKLAQGSSVVSDLSSVNGHTAVLSSNDTSPTEVYALEGERDQAFEWLNRSVALGNENRPLFEHDPNLTRLREDGRFAALLAQINRGEN